MDPIRLGRQLRAIRIRKQLRQEDVGRIARLSRAVVSRIERGAFESVSVGLLVRVATALGATVDVRIRWNGEQVDRLLDQAHARLVEAFVLVLRASGWEVAVEVSFSVWGERGSIDVFAYHRLTGMVLVVEVKSVVPDSQATIHGLDRKTRLAEELAEKRGWRCRGVARLLVIGSSATSRRRVGQLEATYATAFPMRGTAVKRWLRNPQGSMSGLLFLSYASSGSASATAPGQQRVRRRGARANQARRVANAPQESA